MKCKWCGKGIFEKDEEWFHEFSTDHSKWRYCVNAIDYPNGEEREAEPSEASKVNEILNKYE